MEGSENMSPLSLAYFQKDVPDMYLCFCGLANVYMCYRGLANVIYM